MSVSTQPSGTACVSIPALVRRFCLGGLRGKSLADAVLRESTKARKKGDIDWGVDAIWWENNCVNEDGDVLSPNRMAREIIALHESWAVSEEADRGRGDQRKGEGWRGVCSFTSSFEDVRLVPRSAQNVSSPSEITRMGFDAVKRDFEPVLLHLRALTMASYPGLDRDDVYQEALIGLWRAMSSFGGKSRFITYAYSAIKKRLAKYARRVGRQRRYESLPGEDCVVARSGRLPDDVPGELHVLSALREIPDSHLVILQAAGYKDCELNEANPRVRRHRAKKALALRLVA